MPLKRNAAASEATDPQRSDNDNNDDDDHSKKPRLDAEAGTEATSSSSPPPTTTAAAVTTTSSSHAGSVGEDAEAKKRAERKLKLEELHMRRNFARKQNHSEVVEEDKRSKMPANWESKKRRVEEEMALAERKKAAEAQGLDFDRLQMLEVSVEESDRWANKRKPADPDSGKWSDFVAATERQYTRNMRQFKPSMEEYNANKKLWEDSSAETSGLIVAGQHDAVSRQGVDRMVADLQKTIERRKGSSRRRTHDAEADIDYINEPNKRYNQAIERAFGKHTQSIKDDLERGTAL